MLIGALLAVFYHAVELRRVHGSLIALATSRYLRLALIWAIAALIVERVYYVAAPLMNPRGLNLWDAHPAPELLSLSVAIAVWHVSYAGRRAAGQLDARIHHGVALREGLAFLGLWATISVVLW